MDIPAVRFMDQDEAETALTWYADLLTDIGELRDPLIRGAYVAGVSGRRITDLTGVAGTTLTRIPLDKQAPVCVPVPPRDEYATILRARAQCQFNLAQGADEEAGYHQGLAMAYHLAYEALDNTNEHSRAGWLDGPAMSDDTVLAVYAASCARFAAENSGDTPRGGAISPAWDRGHHRGLCEGMAQLAEEINRVRSVGEACLDLAELAEARSLIDEEVAAAFGRKVGMTGDEFAALDDLGKAEAFDRELRDAPVIRGLRLQAQALGVDEDGYLELAEDDRARLWAKQTPKEPTR